MTGVVKGMVLPLMPRRAAVLWALPTGWACAECPSPGRRKVSPSAIDSCSGIRHGRTRACWKPPESAWTSPAPSRSCRPSRLDALAPRVAAAARGPGAGHRAGQRVPGLAGPAVAHRRGRAGRLRRRRRARARRHRGRTSSIGIGGSYLGARAVLDALPPAPGRRPAGALRRHEPLHRARWTASCATARATRLPPLRHLQVGHHARARRRPSASCAACCAERYGDKGAAARITVVTDARRGALRELADAEGWDTFVIPDDVGGRFSVLTPVGLLPLAVAGVDVRGAGRRRARHAARPVPARACATTRRTSTRPRATRSTRRASPPRC